LPVRPDVSVTGVVDSECTMFKSALTPMLVSFSTLSSKNYKVCM